MGDSIGEKNLFLLCRRPNAAAFAPIPAGYHARHCRPEELTLWMDLQFDDPAQAEKYRPFMQDYFDNVYRPKGDLFFERCLFLCDGADRPAGTCFVWKAYDAIQTLHWLKVKKSQEGHGLGRALLTLALQDVPEQEYPVYLHTHPACTRALKLYSDFGFALVTDPMVGHRTNDVKECLPYLESELPPPVFQALRFETAPEEFLLAAASSPVEQF